MTQKKFYINKKALLILLTVLSLLLLVGTIIAIELTHKDYKVFMIVSLPMQVVAYVVNYIKKRSSVVLYGINALWTIIVFCILIDASGPKYYKVYAILLLIVLSLLCMGICIISQIVVSVNDKFVLFQCGKLKKYLICNSINVVCRGLLHTVTIKTASGKISIPFVDNADQLMSNVLDVRFAQNDVNIAENE